MLFLAKEQGSEVVDRPGNPKNMTRDEAMHLGEDWVCYNVFQFIFIYLLEIQQYFFFDLLRKEQLKTTSRLLGYFGIYYIILTAVKLTRNYLCL